MSASASRSLYAGRLGSGLPGVTAPSRRFGQYCVMTIRNQLIRQIEKRVASRASVDRLGRRLRQLERRVSKLEKILRPRGTVVSGGDAPAGVPRVAADGSQA